jgi:hypothetical protein
MEMRGAPGIFRVLMAAACHEAGHRGTLYTLLRMNGVSLPEGTGLQASWLSGFRLQALNLGKREAPEARSPKPGACVEPVHVSDTFGLLDRRRSVDMAATADVKLVTLKRFALEPR